MKPLIIVMIVFSCLFSFKGNIEPEEINQSNLITDPDNWDYVIEIAFNRNISVYMVTQEQFDDRYINSNY